MDGSVAQGSNLHCKRGGWGLIAMGERRLSSQITNPNTAPPAPVIGGLQLKLETAIFALRVNRVFSWMLSNVYDMFFGFLK